MRGERSKLCEKITRFKDAAALDAGTFNRSTRKLPRYGTTFVQRRTETLRRTIIDQETKKKEETAFGRPIMLSDVCTSWGQQGPRNNNVALKFPGFVSRVRRCIPAPLAVACALACSVSADSLTRAAITGA